MSQNTPESGTIDRIERQTNGITVRKRIELTEESIAKACFGIDCARAEPVGIELVDRLPDGLSAEAVGFHADFHPDGWTVRNDEEVVFEGRVEPGDGIVTMYAVKLPSRELARDLQGPPAVELSDGGAEPDDVEAAIQRIETAGEEKEDVDETRDAPAPTTDGGVPDPPKSDAGGPETAAGATGAAGATREGGRDGDPGEPPSGRPEPGDLVAGLLSELEQGSADDRRRAALREALGLDASASFEARLRHVQGRVDDLVAYREALEAFIDENGTAQQIILELQDEQAAIREDLDAVEGTLSELDDRIDGRADAERVDALSESVESLNDEIASARRDHESAVSRLDRRLDELEASLHEEVDDRLSELEATVREDLSELREEVRSLRADVEAGEEWRRSVEEAFVGR